MLRLFLPLIEGFDDDTEEFVTIREEMTVELEYSLYTVSIWESKWKKPFLAEFRKLGLKEKIGLIQAMCVTPDVPSTAWLSLTQEHYTKIWEYISDPMSATTIRVPSEKGPRETVTTELIYFWMITLGIPFECEHWHLNRLLKLIQLTMIKNSPRKKMSKRETIEMYHSLNQQRRAALGTSG